MMHPTIDSKILLQEIDPGRRYSNSLLSVARDFWYVSVHAFILEVADALQKMENVGALSVVDDEVGVVGVIKRDALFSLVGKPYGRDVLLHSKITEIMEKPPMLKGSLNLFSASAVMRDWDAAKRSHTHLPLVDEDGALQGLLAVRDLSEHLARMTEDDIDLAGVLQERLVSGTEFMERADVTYIAWSRSAKGVGGDFYFVRELENGSVFAALCDVSGKGVAASIIVAMVWGFLRAFDFRRGLRELIAALNRTVVSTFHMEKYLTGFFMVYEPGTERMVCADMGHSHMFFMRGNRVVPIREKKLNLPVGIEYDIDPSLIAIKLKRNDALFIFSDGMVEQENSENREYGEERLGRFLLENQESGDTLKLSLPMNIDEFRGSVPQQDDMSFLLFRFNGIQASGAASSTRK